MLYRWNLPRLCIFMKPLIWKKIRASTIGRGRAWPKNLWKKAKKLFSWLNFLEFSRLYQKPYHISYIILHCITGKNVVQIRLDLGLQSIKNHPKAAKNPTFCCYEKLWKHMTWQPQILYWWNLPGLCISMKPFIWPKIGVLPIKGKRAWSKSFWKPTTKWAFSVNFLEF